jgi:hypothetical protein
MEKEFCSYEQALALKELGFDDDVLAWYDAENKLLNTGSLWQLFKNDDDVVLAPLKQQVFRWLYGKTNRWIIPIPNDDKKGEWYGYGISYKSFEEAENACIDKLILIAQEHGKD